MGKGFVIMSTSHIKSLVCNGAFFALAAAPLSACGGGPDTSAEVSVRSFASHYAADGKQFADLDALAAWVDSAGAQVVRIGGCLQGSGDALLAAAVHFRDRYVDLRPLLAADADCAADRPGVAQAAGLPGRQASETVEQYFLRVAP